MQQIRHNKEDFRNTAYSSAIVIRNVRVFSLTNFMDQSIA